MPKQKRPSKPKKPSKAVKPTALVKPTKQASNFYRPSELEEVAHVLPHLYMKLAQAYVDGGGELNPYIIEEYVPGLIFEMAEFCRWISNSSYRISNTLSPNAVQDPVSKGWYDPDKGMVGNWLVNKTFETEFFKLLEPAIVAVREVAESTATRTWHTPTPAKRVEEFLEEQAWTKARLIGKMADKLPAMQDKLQAAKKNLAVITKEPEEPNRLKDYHFVLRDVMSENSPSCASLEPLDLVWRFES
jgi:hypothetical protein